MERNEPTMELYHNKVYLAISQKLIESIREERSILKTMMELKALRNSIKACRLPIGDFLEMEDNLSNLLRRREEAKIRRKTWEQARELCMDILHELSHEGDKEE